MPPLFCQTLPAEHGQLLFPNYWIIDDDLSFGKSLRRMLNARGVAAEYFGSAQSFLDSVPPGQAGWRSSISTCPAWTDSGC